MSIILRIICAFILAGELLALVWWSGTVSISRETYFYNWVLCLSLFFFAVTPSKLVESKLGLVFALTLTGVTTGFAFFKIQSGISTFEKIALGTWAEIFLGVAWFIYIWIVLSRKRNTTIVKE